MKDIVIIGAGGFGREVTWLIEEINKVSFEWNILGFIDDNDLLQSTLINGYPVIGNTEWLKDKECYAVIALGDPIAKTNIVGHLKNTKLSYPILIHPSVITSTTLSIGEGTIICAGSLITVNVLIGKHVSISAHCTISHDTQLGDYSVVLPSVNISGNVKIASCVSIGTNSTIIQGINVGEKTIIGAGSVVIRDIPSYCTAVGSPCRPIKTRLEDFN